MRKALLALGVTGLGLVLAVLAFGSGALGPIHAQEEVPDEETIEVTGCDADVTLDGLADVQDLVLIAVNLFTTDPLTIEGLDVNGDGLVDVEDLAAVTLVFGETCADNATGITAP